MNKKIILSVGVVVVFLGYIAYNNTNSSAPAEVLATPVTDNTPPPTSVPNETTNPNTEGTHTEPPVAVPTNGKYKDGSYTGTVADAFYGPLQVKAVIAGGKLTDVQFLQYPNDRETSIEVSNMALPKLKAMAIAVQSSKVDAVSGATQTREAFEVSLASALSKAI